VLSDLQNGGFSGCCKWQNKDQYYWGRKLFSAAQC